MKKLYCILLAGVFSIQALAQKEKTVHILAEAGSFLNLNGVDMNKSGSSDYISQKNHFGGYIGGGIQLNNAKMLYFQASTGYRFSPQTIVLKDGDNKFEQSFTNSEWYVKITGGVRFNVTPGNKITFGIGLNNFYSINNKRIEDQLITSPYKDPATGENLQHLSGVLQLNWGDTRDDKIVVPFIVNSLVQIGFENTTLLPKNRKIGINFDFSTRITPDGFEWKGNSGRYDKLDESRNIITSQRFVDNYMAVGVNIFVTLF